MNNMVKKQHFIAQSILEMFFENKEVYECILTNKKIVKSNVKDVMEMNYFYELPELQKNTLEKYFSKTIESEMKNIVESMIKNIEQIDVFYDIFKKNILLFLKAYYKSLACITENTDEIMEIKSDSAIRKMLNTYFDERYLKKLSETIICGYDYCIIKSENKFLMSDQYISTASLDVKNKFANGSNRNIGLKNTIILLPLTTSYYLLLYHGGPLTFAKSKEIVSLTNEEVYLVNKIIFKNSYLKVVGIDNGMLEKIKEDTKSYNVSKTQCIIGGKTKPIAFYNNKKEVFVYEKEYEILECFLNGYWWSFKNLKRNDICSCGSAKKYKKCCIEKIKKCKQMYMELSSRNEYLYRISPDLISEKEL